VCVSSVYVRVREREHELARVYVCVLVDVRACACLCECVGVFLHVCVGLCGSTACSPAYCVGVQRVRLHILTCINHHKCASVQA